MARRRLPRSISALETYRAAFLNTLNFMYPGCKLEVAKGRDILEEFFLDELDLRDAVSNITDFTGEVVTALLGEERGGLRWPGHFGRPGNRYRIYYFCNADRENSGINLLEMKMLDSFKSCALNWLNMTGVKDSECREWMIWAFIVTAYENMRFLGLDDDLKFSRLSCSGGPDTVVANEREDDSIPKPPKLPHYWNQGVSAYKSKCNEIIEKYLREIEVYAAEKGVIIIPKKSDVLARQLRWLIWKLKEGWSYGKIVDEESKLNETADTPQISSIHEAISGPEGLAKILGIRLNQAG